MEKIKLRANAKINLFLNVINKRKDGYHNIKTIFQEISLFDEIYIEEIKNGIKIICDSAGIPTDKRNLVYKAADLIKKHSNIKKGVLIKIKKRIPIGAGLGGGSSDASAVLKGLNKLWHLNLSKKELIEIGKRIGADVPFFIEGGRCMAVGIGEILKSIPVKKNEWYVIVKPDFEISTKYVYSQLTKPGKNCKITQYYNKLEEVVVPLYPEIKEIKEKLLKYGAKISLMSGSGSCVFGIVNRQNTGKKIKNILKKDGYFVWLVHPVKKDEQI
jgi:4-diphosphocytidyl-2-C-methyl-D-erythritol kinase